MECFEVFDTMINDFELFLYHGHTLSEMVVLSHLAGQLVDFGIGDCLCYLKALLHVTLTAAVTYDNARQGDEACQDTYRTRYHSYGDFCIQVLVATLPIATKSVTRSPMACESTWK